MIVVSNLSQLDTKQDYLIMVGGKHCMACKSMKPSVLETETSYPKVDFFYLDGEDFIEFSEKYEISNLPSFLLFKDKTLLETLKGAMPKKKFVEVMSKVFS